MQIFGLMMVRNELDILRVNLLHHLAQGVDQFLIVDNGSTDGTTEVLDELSRETGQVHWTRDEGPHRQAEITTELAHEACLRGADWVVPIDADEFWYAPDGDLRGVLERTEAGALEVQVVDFVQRREQLEATADGLLHMTRRVAGPIGPANRLLELVESRRFAIVETVSAPKWISRPNPEIEIARGNHSVRRASGPNERTDQIVCLHAPLRARSKLKAKMVDHGRRAHDLALAPGEAWHMIRWYRLGQEGALDMEWRANSYEDDCLDVYGVKHGLVYDPRLRDLAARWIRTDAEAGLHDECQWERSALLQTVHAQLSSYFKQTGPAPDGHRELLSMRDAAIRGLQTELHEKLGEANRVIADLQAELHEKLGEANRVIAELQAEQQTKIDEREQSIHDLQIELHEKVGEANGVIAQLQGELHEKVGQANVVIRDLQAQLAAARDALAQAALVEDTTVDGAADALAEHDRAIRTLEAEVAALQQSRAWRVVGTYYGLRELLRAGSGRLRRVGRGH